MFPNVPKQIKLTTIVLSDHTKVTVSTVQLDNGLCDVCTFTKPVGQKETSKSEPGYLDLPDAIERHNEIVKEIQQWLESLLAL